MAVLVKKGGGCTYQQKFANVNNTNLKFFIVYADGYYGDIDSSRSRVTIDTGAAASGYIYFADAQELIDKMKATGSVSLNVISTSVPQVVDIEQDV